MRIAIKKYFISSNNINGLNFFLGLFVIRMRYIDNNEIIMQSVRDKERKIVR